MPAAAGEPRRGSRTRKAVERFAPTNADEDGEGSDGDSDLSEESADERPVKATKRKANGTRAPRPAKRVKAPRNVAAADLRPAEGFKTDSPLFNATLQPDVALQQPVEDWVHAYQNSVGDEAAEKSTIHELILFFIRASGINADLDEDEAMDVDGVGDTVERIQDESVKTDLAAYPLISKAKGMKPFKSNLASVISHLIATLSLTPYLFEDAQRPSHSVAIWLLLQTWLGSMSSSPLRPIRHTSTFIALKVNTALCEAVGAIKAELELKQRQREVDAKKKVAKARLNEADEKIAEIHKRLTTLEKYMKDLFNIIFVHRIRDADPAIRIDCLHELGVWGKTFPAMFAANIYLTHLYRGTSDPDGGARLESVKAVATLLSDATSMGANSFTLRVAPRLIEMASLDVETSVRANAINVLATMDKGGVLEDDEELKNGCHEVARLIFDEEPRIRKAAASFVKGLWDKRASALETEFEAQRDGKKRRAGKMKKKDLEEMFEWKGLASLLVETSQSLDKAKEPSTSAQAVLFATGSSTPSMTRAAAAAEGLWPHLKNEKDSFVEYMLLDHSTHEDDKWLLDEDEEQFMLSLLIATFKREDKDDEEDEKTQKLMQVLPKLLAKHQAEAQRVADILSLPRFMNLSLYLDMRMTTAYESLWDDITKQFLQHTDPVVLAAAIQAVNTLSSNASMATVNATKLGELEEAVFSSLRDAIGGEDVGSMSLDEDQTVAIEAILLRIQLLAVSRNITAAMADEEGGQSSGWTIVSAFARRGGLGFKEEAKIVEYAIRIMFLHLSWLVKSYSEQETVDEAAVETFNERRDEALDIYETFGIDGRTNTAQTVRQQAFIAFINLYMLLSPRGERLPAALTSSALQMADDKQHRLGGMFQDIVERHAGDSQASEDEEAMDTEKEVVFIRLVSVFIGAIRCGIIDVEQAKEPLSYVGRFGATYDAVAKKLVDVLRDEGIYSGDATTVQHIIGEALQNSFVMYMDSDREGEAETTTALARLAANAFVVHGTHFTVLKTIHPSDVCDMHVAALDWLYGLVGQTVKQQVAAKGKETKARLSTRRTRLMGFLKPLSLLLGPVSGRDALRIKSHLESIIDQSEAASQCRASVGYRAYEKRLVGIAGKDSGLKVAPRRAQPVEEDDLTELDEGEEEAGEEEEAAEEEEAEEGAVDNEPEDEREEPEEPDEVEEAAATEDAEDPIEDDNETTPRPNKRALPDEEDLPTLEFDTPGMDMDQEIDLAFSDPPREASEEPATKRRRRGRK